MEALALALALALGPADIEEDRLPRSLSESFVLPVEVPVNEGHEVLVGLHFGAANVADADGPGFVVGIEWRIHILPWLGAAGSVDYQTRQQMDNLSRADFFQIPLMWSVLLYPPLELGGLRFYGLAGVGFTITHVTESSVRSGTDLNLLSFLGLGVEFRLASNVMLDADVRFVWAQDPAGTSDFSADWTQVTVGLLVKLPL